MILSRNCLLITISYKHSRHIVMLFERILIIKLPRECNHLFIRTSTNILSTRFLIITFFGECYNNIFSTVVGPGRNEHCIVIIKRGWIRSSIIYCKHCIKRETFQHFVQIYIHSCIKLKLTTCPLAASCCITISKRISRICLTTG